MRDTGSRTAGRDAQDIPPDAFGRREAAQGTAAEPSDAVGAKLSAKRAHGPSPDSHVRSARTRRPRSLPVANYG